MEPFKQSSQCIHTPVDCKFPVLILTKQRDVDVLMVEAQCVNNWSHEVRKYVAENGDM